MDKIASFFKQTLFPILASGLSTCIIVALPLVIIHEDNLLLPVGLIAGRFLWPVLERKIRSLINE